MNKLRLLPITALLFVSACSAKIQDQKINGAISGATSGYITSGGTRQGAAKGAARGAGYGQAYDLYQLKKAKSKK